MPVKETHIVNRERVVDIVAILKRLCKKEESHTLIFVMCNAPQSDLASLVDLCHLTDRGLNFYIDSFNSLW